MTGIPPPPSANDEPPTPQDAGVFVPPPPTADAALGARKPVSRDPGAHTWWGMGDIALGAVFILIIAAIGAAVAGVLFGDGTSGATSVAELSAAVVVISTLVQQIAMFGWPILVTKWKGSTLASDWDFRFSKWDPLLGIALSIGTAILTGLFTWIVTSVSGTEPGAGSNTAILTRFQSSPWIVGLVFSVVIGAPLSEELFFRGLCRRAIGRRFGRWPGVIGSTVLFTIIHFPDDFGLENILLLWGSIAIIGLAFALTTEALGRLGPAIFGHMAVNGLGVAAALGSGMLDEQALGVFRWVLPLGFGLSRCVY